MNGNIRNFYHNRLDARLTNRDYWDLFLAPDEYPVCNFDGVFSGTSTNSLIASFDFNNPLMFGTGSTSAETICSLATWTGASISASGVTLNDIGLTGIDNGRVKFTKPSGDTNNEAFLSAFTGSTLFLSSGDTRLCLHQVTGLTDTIQATAHTYPIEIIEATTASTETGDYVSLCGGFYQGFYKLDGYDYQVMPNRYEKSFVTEVWLKKNGTGSTVCSGVTGTTLNDTYPDNKGFYFFMGTRAENKFWNEFSGLTSGNTCPVSGITGTSGCTIPKETNTTTSNGIPLNTEFYKVTETDNKFVFFNRTPTGETACSFTGQTFPFTSYTQQVTLENPFIIYNRTPTGQTACSYTGETGTVDESDYESDIICNAFGLRVRDDGSIGYRLLNVTGSCSGDTYISGVTVEEDYSISGLVEDDKWTNITTRFVYDYTLDECELKTKPARTGKLMVYVNGKLKQVFRDVKEIIPKALLEQKEKQQGVPFNISLGGGSQGLIDSMTLDGPDPSDDNLPIETYFAGTFIGGISKFRIYKDDLNYCIIQNNFQQEAEEYGIDPNAYCFCKYL